MLKITLLTLGIIIFAIFSLCVKIILKPGSRFGSTHIGDSKAMRDRGIHCVQSMDVIERMERKERISKRIKQL